MTTVTLNGLPVTFKSDPNTPLLWALRDERLLTGTKFGCGVAACGACTVQVDGVATRSCVMPLVAVAGKRITTIEGLHPTGQHPVQQAWVEAQVPQCGYCQSGFIMAAAALLLTTPKPNEQQVAAALNNICRCGTTPRMHQAVQRAAALVIQPAVKPAVSAGGAAQ